MIKDLSDISDGKIYDSNDMARLACGNCAGCSVCCEDMGASIILDPMDVWRLSIGTGKSFETLLQREISLGMVEGLLLPHLSMVEETLHCAFLSDEGRCSIHDYRPGLCRTFPLGRIYEERSVRYFLQKDGCKKQNRSKIKIEKWLDVPQNEAYEKYLVQWHDFRKRAGEYGKKAGEEETKALNMLIFGLLYQKPYEEEAFYQQFSGRLKQIPL